VTEFHGFARLAIRNYFNLYGCYQSSAYTGEPEPEQLEKETAEEPVACESHYHLIV
jgi:hypothetical protein